MSWKLSKIGSMSDQSLLVTLEVLVHASYVSEYRHKITRVHRTRLFILETYTSSCNDWVMVNFKTLYKCQLVPV